jgi:hypothetical protein
MGDDRIDTVILDIDMGYLVTLSQVELKIRLVQGRDDRLPRCSWRGRLVPCPPRHRTYRVPVFATPFTTQCISACHVIHHVVHRCSPRHSPRSVSVLAMSFTAWCIGVRHVIHHGKQCIGACRVIQHVLYQCPARHPPHGVSVLAMSSTTYCLSVRHVIRQIVHQCLHPPQYDSSTLELSEIIQRSRARLVIHHVNYRFSSYSTSHDAASMVYSAPAAGVRGSRGGGGDTSS